MNESPVSIGQWRRACMESLLRSYLRRAESERTNGRLLAGAVAGTFVFMFLLALLWMLS